MDGSIKWSSVTPTSLRAARTTRAASLTISEPRYSMLRSTSVVITRQGASGLSATSPVSSPQSKPAALKSRYFWLLIVLMGEVYTARVRCRVASASAYSATAVLPALVCAATNTFSPLSSRSTASFWNVSSS